MWRVLLESEEPSVYRPLSLASPLGSHWEVGQVRTRLYSLWPLLKCTVILKISFQMYFERKLLTRTVVDGEHYTAISAEGTG